MATDEDVKKPFPQRMQDSMSQMGDQIQGSQAWNSIFPPGLDFSEGLHR